MAVVDYDDGNYSVFNLFQQVKEEQKLRVVDTFADCALF